MSNEKIIEEVLMEAHQLGVEKQVFELVTKLKHQNLVDRYFEALLIVKKQNEQHQLISPNTEHS